jgi:ureidoglycolate lyase
MKDFVLDIEPLTAEMVSPFGWMLGKPFPTADNAVAYGNGKNGFWHEHTFDPGSGGEHEILWVTYDVSDPTIDRLESHRFTQQAVIPLLGGIIQVVTTSNEGGSPDLASAKAFALSPGTGICMRPGVWHATRTVGQDTTCLMLTRRSTTIDLIHHLAHGFPAVESRILDIDRIRLNR